MPDNDKYQVQKCLNMADHMSYLAKQFNDYRQELLAEVAKLNASDRDEFYRAVRETSGTIPNLMAV